MACTGSVNETSKPASGGWIESEEANHPHCSPVCGGTVTGASGIGSERLEQFGPEQGCLWSRGAGNADFSSIVWTPAFAADEECVR